MTPPPNLLEAAKAAIDAWTEEGHYSEVTQAKMDKAMRRLFAAVNSAAAEPEAPRYRPQGQNPTICKHDWHYSACPKCVAEPEAPKPLTHVSGVATRKRPDGDRLASCGAEAPGVMVTALKDSNCLACWKFYYGDADGERHFRKHHPEMP